MASLAKWLSVRLRTKWFWVRVQFQSQKNPHKCLSVIILDSVIYAYEKYYPQTFLEECKYVKTNVRTKNHVDMELESERDTDTDSETDIYIDIDSDNEE